MKKLRAGQAIKFKNVVLEITKTEKSDTADGWITFKPLKVRRWWVEERRSKL